MRSSKPHSNQFPPCTGLRQKNMTEMRQWHGEGWRTAEEPANVTLYLKLLSISAIRRHLLLPCRRSL